MTEITTKPFTTLPTTEQECFLYCENAKELKKNLETGWLVLAEMLINIKQNKLADISQYGSFSLYLDEIKMKPSTAEHLMRAYRKFVIEWNIEHEIIALAGGPTRAYEVLSVVNNEQEAREALAILQNAPNKGSIKKVVREALYGATMPPECLHEEVEVRTVCKCCHGVLAVTEGN